MNLGSFERWGKPLGLEVASAVRIRNPLISMYSSSDIDENHIAIIGISGRFPKAANIEDFWDNLVSGRDSVVHYSKDELLKDGIEESVLEDPLYVRAQILLENPEEFDAGFFDYSRREAEEIDPQQRIFLECVWEAIESAGYSPFKYEGPIGLFGSIGMNFYLHELLKSGVSLVDSVKGYQLMLGNTSDHLSTRVGYKLDLKGPCVGVQSACSSSLVAVHHACQSLITGECDMAAAGGVFVGGYRKCGYLYEPGSIRSSDGYCRVFDKNASGTVRGAGAGVVFLKPLIQAIDDGDYIRGIIRASAINNDGHGKIGYTAPSVDGQSKVIFEAIEVSGVDVEKMAFVEAHGTGTILGDPIEVKALSYAFKEFTSRKKYCAIGSVKSNIGHLDVAAGVAGLIKAVLALEKGVFPATLNFDVPNPELQLEESPFYVAKENVPIERLGSVAYGCVSSFGIGGTNAHVVLQSPPPFDRTSSEGSLAFFPISAKSPATLRRRKAQLFEFLKKHPDVPLADAAYTLQRKSHDFTYRDICLGRNPDEMLGDLSGSSERVVRSARKSREALSIGFLFPGQGAQRVGMGYDLYKSSPVFRSHIDSCDAILSAYLDIGLVEMLYPKGDRLEETEVLLTETKYAQPALFAIEYSLAMFWMSFGLKPDFMIGHSLGELTAACIAGIWSLEDAARIVCERGRLMGESAVGQMMALPIGESLYREKYGARTDCEVAAINAPNQVVVGGSPSSIERLRCWIEDDHIEYKLLKTTRAFHSGSMESAARKFEGFMESVTFNEPVVSIISNLTGKAFGAENATPIYWSRQMREAVKFSECVETVLDGSNKVFLEVGPGATLSSFIESHPGCGEEHLILSSLQGSGSGSTDLSEVGRTLRTLWGNNMKLEWPSSSNLEDLNCVPLPTYPFERSLYSLRPDAQSQSSEPVSFDDSEIDEHRLLSSKYVPPRNEIDAAIVDIWQSHLKIDKIGIHDDYYELGGHSLLAIQIINDMSKVFDIDLKQEVFFEQPMISKISDWIESVRWLKGDSEDKLLEKDIEIEYL